jgi:Tat protein secretion system quality control protein TatD with DNase activity
VVAKVKGVSMEEVCEAAYKNTRALFKLGDEVKDV